jgi:hypothetical protein
MCHIVPLPTIVPVIAHLTELSAAHRTLQSSVMAAGRFNQPYQHSIALMAYVASNLEI